MRKTVTTLSEAGKLGVIKTNKLLTTKGRSKAAKLGWKRRNEKLKGK